MDNKFTVLDCNDDDVILLQKDTFKVSRLKELLSQEISTKLNLPIYSTQTKSNQDGIIISTFSQLSVNLERIKVDEIQVNSTIACQILSVGSKGWQKGNLKIQVKKPIVNQPPITYLEFHLDKPNEPESPLDELRQMIKS